MPIYEYRCQKCENDVEVMQKLSDAAPDLCEKCGAKASFERLMSRTSFQLKGGGWYSDLYGSTKKETPTADATASPATPAEAKATPAAAAAPAAASTPAAAAPSSGSSGNSGSSS
jgi:putative FmdB family regulatory protein